MPNVQKLSLLCSKPVKNIKPETLGWIRPDGIINFATKDAAKTYAVNRCRAANALKDKFERGVIVKDNMILQENNGNATIVLFDFKKLSGYKDCDLYHNHPVPGTLSNIDFGQLKIRKCLRSMTAIDIYDRFYVMTKLPAKKIKFVPQGISTCMSNLIQCIRGIAISELLIQKYNKKYKDLFKNFMKELEHQTQEEIIKTPIFKEYCKAHVEMTAALDKLWSEKAESLGIKYEHYKI